MTMNASDFSAEIEDRVHTEANIEISDFKYPINRLSDAVRDFLVSIGEDPLNVAGLPALEVPETIGSHPLRDYYISSSHNTYLLSRQLLGVSSAQAYTHVLKNGARCVEIDVWPHPKDSEDPIVTHGYTFSKSVPFKDVCEAINLGAEPNDWPVMISLECHVPLAGQPRLIQIMKETFKEKLVEGALEGVDTRMISPMELRGRIVLIVEHYPEQSIKAAGDGAESDTSSSSSSSSSSDSDYSDSPEAKALHEEKRKEAVLKKRSISPELEALGVYAHSIKPKKGWLTRELEPDLNVLINISESAISKLIPTSLDLLVQNATEHLRRVYPRGTRIRSSNLNPIKYWGNGSQIAALNWQTFDTGVQLNEALFIGSPGWSLKNPPLREGVQAELNSASKIKFACRIFGASGLPHPKDGKDDMKVRVKAEILTPSGKQSWESKSIKSELRPGTNEVPIADPVWDENFKFEIASREDRLIFIRLSIDDVGLLSSTKLGIFCARITHLNSGWRLVRLLAPSGKCSGATLLLNFSFQAI